MIGKIYTKINTKIIRYENKNTISGQYTRYKNRAKLFTLASGGEMLRLPSWGVEDIGICSMLITLALKNIRKAYKCSKALKPIKQRATSIKRQGFRKEL